MIKFFRKIRETLLSEGKTGKYLKYALGEIILVVIGILIAIQINEWNQTRIERKQYIIMLQNLEQEFRRNKELLTTISSNYVSSINANIKLMQQFSAENHLNLSDQQIDTLLGQSLKQAPFYPPQPVLSELLNSGKIKSLPNENIKRYLFDWESTIKWFHFDYDLMINFSNNHLSPYMNKHVSWKNIEIAEGSIFFKERSTLTPEKNAVFKELEFENLIDNNLFHTNRLYIRLQNINTLMDKILIEIEKSLQK